MSQEVLTVEQVARDLKLHVRTIRNYVRDGRLRATRIGKQYRITRADLEAFTGVAAADGVEGVVARHSRVDVSSVVQIEAISRDSAQRLAALLVGAHGRKADGTALSVATVYDEERDRLRVIASGDLRVVTDVLTMIGALTRLEPTGTVAG